MALSFSSSSDEFESPIAVGHQLGHRFARQPHISLDCHSRREHAVAVVDEGELVVARREAIGEVVVVDVLPQVVAASGDADFHGVVADEAL